MGSARCAIDGSQTGLSPLSSASVSCSPVSVRITVRLPNGSTANTSPQVISPGCLVRRRRGQEDVGAQPAGVGERRLDAGVLGSASRRRPGCPSRTPEPVGVAQDVERLGADHLVAQLGGLRVGLRRRSPGRRRAAPHRGSSRPGWPRRPTPRRRRSPSAAAPSSWLPALMPSVTRMSPDASGWTTRWVCPATIASTVVSCSRSAMVDDRAVPRDGRCGRRSRLAARARCPRGSPPPAP